MEVPQPIKIQPEATPTVTPSNGPAWKRWTGLVVLSLALAIIIIDTTLLNVSLGTLIRELHTNIQSLQWVITVYALVLAALTITGGRLGDLYGRKKMFMVGAGIFALGSFLASISKTVPVLLLGESIIEGIGAALMMPATASLVVANFQGKERATAFGIWGAVAGASSAIGPLLGGFLTTHYSWRWGFRINVFVAAILIAGAIWLIKESRDTEEKPTLDWLGVILSSLGLFSIAFGIIESSSLGWWKAKDVLTIGSTTLDLGSISLAPLALAFGIILLVAFVWWELAIERQGKTPLVSMQLFKNFRFTSGSVTCMILSLGMTGLFFALPIFFQSVKGLDAFHTGLAMLPSSLVMFAIAPFTGLFTKKVSPRFLIQAGLLIDTAALIWMGFMLSPETTVANLIPVFLVHGLGIALIMPSISNLTLSAVPVYQAGEASGVNNTLRQVGSSLGAAIVGAALLTSVTTNIEKGIRQSQVIPPQAKNAIIEQVSKPSANVEFGGAQQQSGNLPQAAQEEMKFIANESTTRGNKDALIYAAMFMFLGFVASLFLPSGRHDEDIEEAHNPHENTGRMVGSGALALAGIAAAIFLLNRSSKADFPKSSIPAITAFAAPNPFQNQSPRSANQSTTPEPNRYKNTDLGFGMEKPVAVSVQENIPKHEVVFSTGTKPTMLVQQFPGVRANMDSIKQTLEQSGTVSGTTETTIGSEKAWKFKVANSTYQQGYAVMHHDKLYYIFTSGDTLDISTFQFID